MYEGRAAFSTVVSYVPDTGEETVMGMSESRLWYQKLDHRGRGHRKPGSDLSFRCDPALQCKSGVTPSVSMGLLQIHTCVTETAPSQAIGPLKPLDKYRDCLNFCHFSVTTCIAS